MASTVARKNRITGLALDALRALGAKHACGSLRPLAIAIALLGCLVAPAAAQDDADTERARSLLQKGDDYLAKGDARRDRGREQRAISYYEKALASYEEAYQLVPKSTIYYAIANAEARLGRYKEAVEHYQKVMAEVDSPELVDLAREAMAGLGPHMGTLVLRVTPDGAELSVDAQLRGVAPFEDPVLLAPGEHTVTITAEGYTPFEMTLTTEAGSRVEKDIALEKIPVLVKQPTALDDAKDDNPLDMPETRLTREPSKTPLIIGGVATGALAAGSAVSLVLGFSKAEGETEGNTTLQIVGLVAGVAALGAAGYTTYHYVGVYRPRKARARRPRQASSPKFWMTPYVHAQGGGVAVGGLF